MSETDSRVINYLAFRQDEIHGPTAQPGIGALILAHADLVIQPGVFPIADTNTLVPDYYAQVNALDTRYAADLEREHYIGAFEDLAARDENVPGELVGMFETCVFEPKFLAMYFGSEDPDKGRPEAVDYFFNRYNVSTNDEVLAIRNAYYSVPLPLREFARDDVSTVHDVMDEVGSIVGISEIADARIIVGDLVVAGIGHLKGQDRLAAIRAKKEDLTKRVGGLLAVQNASSDESVHKMRVHRKQSPLDGLDAATFRSQTNHDVAVDPAYLFNPRYDRLAVEPELPWSTKLGFLRHMVNGESRFGHAHTFLYRNKHNISSTHAGIIPDYGISRPGNFLYHDLKLLEKGPYKEGFPLEVLQGYFLDHYLSQMDSDMLGEDDRPLHPERGAEIGFHQDDKIWSIPLVREDGNVIPFRALKKTHTSDDYYEYGEECYLAELVDITLQLKKIAELRDGVDADDSFVARLMGRLEGLRLGDGRNAGHVAGQQLEYMNGRLPLTCSYEWFMRYSRLVPQAELKSRGISPKKPLFPGK